MSTSPSSEVLPIDAVRPYWRNPRKITEEAIDGVRASLEEFGYVQPVVVDTENVIIIGHTRYTAARRLGATEIEVIKVDLSPAKAKQLRIVDNRTHEYAWWDFDKLRQELDGLGGDELMLSLFPEARAPQDDGGAVDDTEPSGSNTDGSYSVEFVCPTCFHEWETQVTREQVLSGRIEETK